MLSIVYLAAAVLVALYGANALLLALLYMTGRRRRADSPSEPQPWPLVTVQLPLYNELHVVTRLVDAVADLDYPLDRLQVQILDDSTDETTALAQSCADRHRARGLDVTIVRRIDRNGFKAGALAHGLRSARGELIAIFDADFVPPPDFLRRTVPHLAADPSLGFVQARWGYLNAGFSAMTRAQSLALDGHFVVEHLARNRNGLLVNFNGTAGVWRREAIVAAGGWQSDTLTEDVDLSFRAQLAGWHALYLPDVEAPAELPPQMAAFKRQQARWASGAAQCLFKLAASLWRGTWTAQGEKPGTPTGAGREQKATGPTLSWPARLEGLLHLSVWFAHPMSLVLFALTLPLLLGRIPLAANLGAFGLVILGPLACYLLSQRYLYPDWRARLAYVPVLALLGTGLALSNTLAIARGLVHRSQPFRRTPKFHVERRGDGWAASRYALPFEWISVAELALAVYGLAMVALAVSLHNYLAVPFLLLYAGGYGYVGGCGVLDAAMSAGRRREMLRRPRTASSV